MIYADPTELRDASVIPVGLLKISKELPGLESLTGADFLVCNGKVDLASPVGEIILRQQVKEGCLIQRKSGGDFLSSIQDLPDIQARMQVFDPSPWLVVTRLSPGAKDTVKISGSKRRNKWRWSSVSGALDAWQDRGGCVKSLPADFDLTQWFESRERRVREWEATPEKAVNHTVKFPKQKLRRTDPGWYNTRMAWPKGVGSTQLAALARYVVEQGRPPTLANAISLACSDEVLKIRGWGKGSLNAVREWYGVTTSVSNMESGAPSWCMIYDWFEGLLMLDGDELMRVESVPIDKIPKGAVVL